MEERGLVGLEARSADGTVAGRIIEILTEESGAVTHVLVENDAEQFEVPITDLSLDPEADFAVFGADPSDEEPGDHVGDALGRDDHAPLESDVEDYGREGQLATDPEADVEGQEVSPGEQAREDWEDESYTADSGFPRNDAYVDPETGDVEVDPLLQDNETLKDDVEDLLDGTDLGVRSEKDGVVELTGSVAARGDLQESVEEIMGLDGVRAVDASDVDVG